MFPRECDGCPYRGQAEFRGGGFVPPDPVTQDTRLVAYGEAPGEEEALAGAGFVGKSGRLLRGSLRMAGLEIEWPQMHPATWTASGCAPSREVAFANTLLCRPPRNVFPGPEVALECLRRHWARHEPLWASGAPVMAFGDNATRTLTGLSFGVLATRGTLLPVRPEIARGRWLVSTLHPAFLVRGDGDEGEKAQIYLRPLLVLDILKALRRATPFVPRWAPTSVWDATSIIGSADRISLDIEGMDKPVLVGFAVRPDEGWVLWWNDDVARWLAALVTQHPGRLVLHNAPFDLVKLNEHGVPMPETWLDTMNKAWVFDPDLPLGLQQQALAHVPGSLTWKELVNHGVLEDEEGFAKADGSRREKPLRIREYRALHRAAQDVCGVAHPGNHLDWYTYYNAIDTTYTLGLDDGLNVALGPRVSYYELLGQPLQRPLIALGQRGLPYSPETRDQWRRRCDLIASLASKTATEYGRQALQMLVDRARAECDRLVGLRDEERAQRLAETGTKKAVKFSKAAEMTKARGRLKKLEEELAAGFNVRSPIHKIALLQDWYGLPLSSGRKTKGISLNDDQIQVLQRKVESGALRPRKGTPREVIRVLKALTVGAQWMNRKANFLRAGEDE